MSESVTQAVEAYERFKKRGSQSTAREYLRHINRFIEISDKPIFECHGGDLEDHYEWMLNDGYAPSSVRVAHAALGDFFNTVDERGGTRGFPEISFEDPTENATPERLDGMHTSAKKRVEGGNEPLGRDEVRDLIENVPQDKPIRNKLIVRLLYQTGIRRSELVNIELDHIHHNERRIDIYAEKTEEQRKVWYKPTLDDLLSLWIEADRNAIYYADESDFLFPSRRSEQMSPQTVTDIVTQAAENAGIQEPVYENHGGQTIRRVGPHTLRKTFGVHFINNGGDISFLMELLGHEDIETTKENYLQYADADLRKSVRQHGPSL
jgi:integrase/recombinase XerD